MSMDYFVYGLIVLHVCFYNDAAHVGFMALMCVDHVGVVRFMGIYQATYGVSV